MMRKCFALLLIFLQAGAPAFASVLTVEEISVVGAAADDYYTGSKTKLKVLGGGNVGKTLITSAELSATTALSGLAAGAAGIAGIAYYERTGQDPVYAVANAVASAADALFVPGYQAFKANFVSPESYPASAVQYVGVEGSVGALIDDIISAVQNSASGVYTYLKDLIASFTSLPTYDPFDSGEVIPTSLGNRLLNGTWATYASYLPSHEGWFINTPAQSGYYQLNITDTSGRHYYRDNSGSYIYRWPCTLLANGYYTMERITCVLTALPAIEPNPGAVNYPALKDALQSPSPDIANDIKDVIKDLPTEQKITSNDPAPSTVPASNPSPITNNQIRNFFAENTTNVYNQYLANAANGTATDVDKAAAETTAQQEDEVQNENEDTYSPLSSNPFQESYNPGEFDIPARFTTFLNNVKSSGLFSFSSDFFDSLPGGGSPLLTIDGGATFGSHTYDFSQAFHGGLTILKSVLLALFGFLSIRAVIMKR